MNRWIIAAVLVAVTSTASAQTTLPDVFIGKWCDKGSDGSLVRSSNCRLVDKLEIKAVSSFKGHEIYCYATKTIAIWIEGPAFKVFYSCEGGDRIWKQEATFSSSRDVSPLSSSRGLGLEGPSREEGIFMKWSER